MTELAAGTFSRPTMSVEIATRSAGPAAPGNEVRVFRRRPERHSPQM